MKQQPLLPYRLKKIGWLLFIPFAIAGIYLHITDYEPNWITTKVFAIYNESLFSDKKWFSIVETNITSTLIGIGFLAGCLLIAFSKEKVEDEFIAGLRLSSLQWAVLVNYSLLLFCFLFIYGFAFMNVLIYNVFTVLLIFIGRFNYLLFKSRKMNADEK
jgi:hypothetical protein